MANWNDIKVKVGKAANTAAKKTGEIADTASKYVKLKSVDVKLSSKYESLGRLTYKQLKNGGSQAQSISAVIEEIDALNEQRKAIKAEIEAEKQRRAEAKAAKKENTEAENDAEYEE